MEILHKILLAIHIPFGFISLILFWIPVGVKKGSKNHKKVGWYYFITMWVVLVSAILLCLTNIMMERYVEAMFLGYLSIITAYPLWYAVEILRQKAVWSDRYFYNRRAFSILLFTTGLTLFIIGVFVFKFQGMGIVMASFGFLGLPAIRDVLMTKTRAMAKETRLKTHIQGTIISGIAAYTAFFAFGGNRILVEVFHMSAKYMFIPWLLPTVLGLVYSRYMKKYQLKRPIKASA